MPEITLDWSTFELLESSGAEKARGRRWLIAHGLDPDNPFHVNSFLAGAQDVMNCLPEPNMYVSRRITLAHAADAWECASFYLEKEFQRLNHWLVGFFPPEIAERDTKVTCHDIRICPVETGHWLQATTFEPILDSFRLLNTTVPRWGDGWVLRAQRDVATTVGEVTPLNIQKVYCGIIGLQDLIHAPAGCDGYTYLAREMVRWAAQWRTLTLHDYIPTSVRNIARQSLESK